jgi:hypothetical protein
MAKTAIRLEHEWSDKPDYTSVKIVDPDGYVVEIASDASLYGVIAYRVDRANWLPTFPQNLTVVICETRSPVYSYPTIGHRSVVGADDCGDETFRTLAPAYPPNHDPASASPTQLHHPAGMGIASPDRHNHSNNRSDPQPRHGQADVMGYFCNKSHRSSVACLKSSYAGLSQGSGRRSWSRQRAGSVRSSRRCRSRWRR